MGIANALDRLIGVWNPERAFRRQQFRIASDHLAKFSGSYRGAESNRLRSSWIPGGGSADEDIIADLPTLRERSRDLIRNDGHAAGIVATLVNNVVGCAIKPQARLDPMALGITPESATEYSNDIEHNFARWCAFADSAERNTFYELQRLIVRQLFENGEVILIPRYERRAGIPYRFSYQIVESDQLNTPFDLMTKRTPEGNSVRGGVEIGQRGQPVAYWIQRTHPGDLSFGNLRRFAPGQSEKDYTKIPARSRDGRPNLLHLYWQLRPGQTRGVPFLAPVLSLFKDMAEYIEAEIVAARVAACFSMFIKRTDPYGGQVAATTETNSSDQRIQNIEPGMVLYGNPNEEATPINPLRPGTNFDPFTVRLLRSVGAGIGQPYEIFAKDFSRTTYTSGRMSLLEAWREFGVVQDWLNTKFNQPTYDDVLEEAFLMQRLDLPGYYENLDAWRETQWIAPVRDWVDPEKEANAIVIELENNLTTASEVIAARGGDWEKVYAQRGVEKKREKAEGIAPEPKTPVLPGNQANGGPDDEAAPVDEGSGEYSQGSADVSRGGLAVRHNGNGRH
jgi:lambda family phage portal protein